MALLPQDQRHQSMLLVVILCVAAAALYYVYVFRSNAEEILEQADRVETLEMQNELAEARIGDLQRLRDRLSTAERQFTTLQRLVPSGAEVPAIYEAIATQTQALNLELINVEPLPPVAADSAGTLLRQEWQMEVEGEYHAVGTFLTRVASFDRIVRPRVTQIVPTETTPSGRQRVRVAFQLETFVVGNPESRPVEAQEG
ncbi:MAG: type 4a pilus biogenesis protein PilO [marine benthic group bacterium]|jgi:Tfp pilus assembly protein PilO|nr:type 4a pilus biogenesis protein PilO [Gemmatimonadota bacterium]MCL7962433.1 type 4a pilus biogenesis protein PilO [Candidatus Carthagonibacter metallireducens]MCL7937612.1 type 4a pilus biogenesis protein PilO [Gemmatimonadota bacterium]MCL7957427.1 type 4a pilus biogenesis protein PilO [Gemmatimonadota bacterium]MCL7964724.1 type 4a pilus biogenesis protein PilO [Gemmatimonadota bacterium]